MSSVSEINAACPKNCEKQTEFTKYHVYFLGKEVSHILFTGSILTLCDVNFIHEDFRKRPIAIESNDCIFDTWWVDIYNPFGKQKHDAVDLLNAGADMKLHTEDDMTKFDSYGRYGPEGGSSFSEHRNTIDSLVKRAQGGWKSPEVGSRDLLASGDVMEDYINAMDPFGDLVGGAARLDVSNRGAKPGWGGSYAHNSTSGYANNVGGRPYDGGDSFSRPGGPGPTITKDAKDKACDIAGGAAGAAVGGGAVGGVVGLAVKSAVTPVVTNVCKDIVKDPPPAPPKDPTTGYSSGDEGGCGNGTGIFNHHDHDLSKLNSHPHWSGFGPLTHQLEPDADPEPYDGGWGIRTGSVKAPIIEEGTCGNVKIRNSFPNYSEIAPSGAGPLTIPKPGFP